MKRKAPNTAYVAGGVRRNGVVACPAAELNLSSEETAMLADPEWVTEDEADGILSKRSEHEPTIPLSEVLKHRGVDRIAHSKR